MRSLITGGAGFVGSHLAEALVSEGGRVIVLDDLSTGSVSNVSHLPHENLEVIEGSVLDRSLVEEVVDEADQVFHLASAVGVLRVLGDPLSSMSTIVDGSRNVLHAAARRGIPTLLSSTSEIYGKNTGHLAEGSDRILGDTTRTRWIYSEAKAIEEHAALELHRRFSFPVVIARLFNTIGVRQSGDYGMVVPRFVRSAASGSLLEVYGDGTQTRCFIDVRDVVPALTALLDRSEAYGNVFNVGSEAEVSILELARLVLSVAGRDSEDYRFVNYDDAYGPGFEELQRRRPDTRRVRSLLGWDPRLSLEVSVRAILTDSVGHPTLIG